MARLVLSLDGQQLAEYNLSKERYKCGRLPDNDIRIENKRTGAGVRITGDRPLTRFGYWSIRTVVAPEPYIDLNIEPGQQFAWTYTFDYYTMK